MDKKKIINSHSSLEGRLLALKMDNEILLRKIKDDATSIKTYLPPVVLSDKLSSNSFSGITDQISKQGLTMGLVLPIILNNTIFRKKSKIVKTLVSSLSLLIGSKLLIQDVPQAIKKLVSGNKKKKNEATALALENDIVVHS